MEEISHSDSVNMYVLHNNFRPLLSRYLAPQRSKLNLGLVLITAGAWDSMQLESSNIIDDSGGEKLFRIGVYDLL